MIGISSPGNFKRTRDFLDAISPSKLFSDMNKYGRDGVDALAHATPVKTGDTAHSWEYDTVRQPGRSSISWYNTHIHNGLNIAILIQYGHGTGTGGYVPGYDYINPAMRPVLDKITDDIWKKVINA